MPLSDEGSMGLISFSIFTGSVSWVISRRLTKRLTWVSTGKPGRPSATLRTTLAVFLPTPGRLTRSDIDSGTDPPNSVINFLAIPCKFFALDRYMPIVLTHSSMSGISASA